MIDVDESKSFESRAKIWSWSLTMRVKVVLESAINNDKSWCFDLRRNLSQWTLTTSTGVCWNKSLSVTVVLFKNTHTWSNIPQDQNYNNKQG